MLSYTRDVQFISILILISNIPTKLWSIQSSICPIRCGESSTRPPTTIWASYRLSISIPIWGHATVAAPAVVHSRESCADDATIADTSTAIVAAIVATPAIAPAALK